MNKPLGIYIHIPFCIKKCNYCDFCSVTDFSLTEKYISALISHIKNTSKTSANTVYIGGGTPTSLPQNLLLSVINAVKESFTLEDGYEFTVECNPKTADLNYFSALKNAGVNRLSIGMQSSNEKELSLLGRIHNYDDTKCAVFSARKAGFDNISLDLMYGIPDQTTDSFLCSLDDAIALTPEHISAYALKIEPGTPFYKNASCLALPDEDDICDMLSLACDKLKKHGLDRYEISNFAKKDFESKHNLKYWKCDPYLSFGVSASSFVNGKRFTYTKNITDYIKYVNGEICFSDVIFDEYEVTKKDEENEYLMLGLRLCSGISKDEFYSLFNIDFDKKYSAKFEKYVKIGLAENTNRYARLTADGMLVSNTILSELLDF